MEKSKCKENTELFCCRYKYIEARLKKAETKGDLYKEELKARQLAKEMGVNSVYLTRYIQECLGYSGYRAYLDAVRINYALRLITQSPLITSQTLIRKTGYKARQSFYKAFKKHTGCTPKKYKTNQRKS